MYQTGTPAKILETPFSTFPAGVIQRFNRGVPFGGLFFSVARAHSREWFPLCCLFCFCFLVFRDMTRPRSYWARAAPNKAPTTALQQQWEVFFFRRCGRYIVTRAGGMTRKPGSEKAPPPRPYRVALGRVYFFSFVARAACNSCGRAAFARRRLAILL